ISKEDTSVIFTEKLYITVVPDSIGIEDNTVELKITAINSLGDEIKTNIGNIKKVRIILKRRPKDEHPIKNYQYLSSVGTNFDLVEGVKPDNLFFATNVFVEPNKNKKDFGIYLSLYGNRTTSIKEEFEQNIFTEIVPVTTDSSYRLRKQVTTTNTTTSDNLGAHFSTLFPIFSSRDKQQGKLKTYFTISTDFIFQRTHVMTEYGDISKVDTVE